MVDLPPLCFRCDQVTLDPTDSAGDVNFFECPACHRRYARSSGGALTERWPGPLAVVLYGALFSKHPQDRADFVAGTLDHLDRDVITAEIRLELREPRQPVREILSGMQASETDLREYLALVADRLERRPSGGSPGDSNV